MTNTYQGLHAAHYDLIYADKPYADEARFVAEQLGRTGGTLLDLACGTGRHAIEFARLGFEVTGIDYGADLLERARANAAAAGLEIEFHHADMRDLDLGRRFDAITCLFDSIGYPVTDQGVVKALRSAREHLEPGARFAAEFLHSAAALSAASPVRVRRWQTPDGNRLLRISETDIDRQQNRLVVDYELIELSANGKGYEQGAEQQTNRFFAPAEMRELMQSAGLEVERIVPAYGETGDVTEDTWHLLAVARPS